MRPVRSDLRQYGFAAESGYEQNDLFVGGSGRRLLLFLCERPAADLPSPNCLATDRPLADGRQLFLPLQARLAGALA